MHQVYVMHDTIPNLTNPEMTMEDLVKNDATAAPSQQEPASRLQQHQDVGTSNTPDIPVKLVKRRPPSKAKQLGGQ